MTLTEVKVVHDLLNKAFITIEETREKIDALLSNSATKSQDMEAYAQILLEVLTPFLLKVGPLVHLYELLLAPKMEYKQYVKFCNQIGKCPVSLEKYSDYKLR